MGSGGETQGRFANRPYRPVSLSGKAFSDVHNEILLQEVLFQMKSLHVEIRGRVQGVFFRAGTQKTARQLNLTGWVKNTADGGVEAYFEGDDARIEEMLAWCRQGPPAAIVTAIESREGPYSGKYSGFNIDDSVKRPDAALR